MKNKSVQNSLFRTMNLIFFAVLRKSEKKNCHHHGMEPTSALKSNTLVNSVGVFHHRTITFTKFLELLNILTIEKETVLNKSSANHQIK